MRALGSKENCMDRDDPFMEMGPTILATGFKARSMGLGSTFGRTPMCSKGILSVTKSQAQALSSMRTEIGAKVSGVTTSWRVRRFTTASVKIYRRQDCGAMVSTSVGSASRTNKRSSDFAAKFLF